MNGDKSIDINRGVFGELDPLTNTINWGKANTAFGKYVEGIDDIAQCWYIILNTIPGSDPLRPNFGSNIFQYLDKPNNGFGGDFATQIIKDLEKWETRCTISKVTPTVGDNDNISVNILGIYTETNTLVSATLSIGTLPTADNTAKMKAYSQDYNDLQYS